MMARATREKRVIPDHLNGRGTLHGGNLMKWMDEVGADAAQCHSERICVTAHVDEFDFLAPVCAGETVLLKASVNRVWGTSMEVGIRAEALDEKDARRRVASAYYVYVALDGNGRPTSVRELIPRTDDDRRRHKEAGVRRRRRMNRRKRS